MNVYVVFLLGLIIGSFLNVCIYRVPNRASIVFPPSSCRSCGGVLRWYHNIPLLSYCFLLGKCSFCSARISIRYPVVELMNGLLFIFIFLEFGFNLTTMPLFIFADILLVVSVIDLDHQIIPDVISLPGTLVGFVCSFAQPWLTWTDSLFGILLGGGSLYVVAVCYELLTKKEGMGGGDIKLLAMIGAFLGWKAIFPVIFFSSLVGTMVGLPLMLFRNQNRRYAIPFGPFLSLAALIYLFYGPQLISWYLDFAKLS